MLSRQIRWALASKLAWKYDRREVEYPDRAKVKSLSDQKFFPILCIFACDLNYFENLVRLEMWSINTMKNVQIITVLKVQKL